ncbi:TPA: hypothetical protein HA318_01060 [Candidatus Micrarchaeota archaeon]|nr:MAG: hypothetical protein AUJ65_03390 [Candidatus Micrarchaeota archaeon CG1_02_51_15]HII38576.1 hypothetical protein [Candidatus Micrarchaeota archaeon]
MDVLALLLKAYFAVEDRYYGVCDVLQKRGLPIYRFFVTPIEKQGLPSLIALFLVVFLLASASFVLLRSSAYDDSFVPLGVIVYGASGERIDGAQVKVVTLGKSYSVTTKYGEAFFNKLVAGQSIALNVEKEGYLPYSGKLNGGETLFQKVSLVREST